MTVFSSISVERLAELAGQRDLDVIDVRTPVEFAEVHVEMARNVPLDTLDPATVMQSRRGSGDDPIYLICGSGNRSGRACQKVVDAGFTNVINVDGGTTAWVNAGLGVVRGKKAIGLERQVRIAAGFLVVLGAALSVWNPLFVILSGFVGAGLMFAGITDTCAMGMLLAKMPWNQVRGKTASCRVDKSSSVLPQG
ncbi:MAG: rhodanese-like domain-containing protein [Pirellulaceae bacterium]|nr:rhodanese-like domain-containing protein [Pirellulaceae bacterium]